MWVKQSLNMKTKLLISAVLGLAVIAGITACAEAKGRPYPLKTCVVSDEKLGGDMGEPYVFVHQGQEIKLCCKSCLKDFNKDTAKYLKKIADAPAAAAK